MPVDPKGRDAPGYERHVFICGHERPEGATRPSCKKRGSLELLSAIKLAAREQGLQNISCLLYTSPSPRDLSTSRMPSSA